MKMKHPVSRTRREKFSDELIARGTKGDKAALEELASQCLPHIWHSVYLACGGSSEVDDIVQNAIIDAFNGLAGFRGTGSFSAWLNRIAVRAVYRHMRRRALWSVISSAEKLEALPDTSEQWPDRKTEERRLLNRVARHMGAVKLKNRLPLVLAMVHGYSAVEIADAVGCNVEAAKKRLQRGRIELGARLQKDPYCRKITEEAGIQ